MEREQATPSSSGLYGGERGAGGKFRKPPARKPPATPYDRPPANQSQTLAERRDGGWLSKLVDPACRLIAGGATKMFPSFFSKSPSTANPPQDQDKWGTCEKEEFNNDDDGKQCTLNVGVSNSTGVLGPIISAADNLNNNSDFDELGREKISNLSDENEFSKIEQLMKGKIFSREEIDHLTEILNSRVLDPSNIEQNKRTPSMTTGGEAERTAIAHENPMFSIEKNQEDLKRHAVGTSTPLLRTTVLDEVGASPVDLAKAYMASQASEVRSEEFASTPFIPSPSLKSTVCWPGAMLHDQRGYLTPQNQRGRSGIHNFPRSPYSRTIYSKSKSKLTPLQAVENRHLSISSTPLRQSRTPIFGQSRNDVLNDGYGSVGPIRRMRHKVVSEAPPRGSAAFNSSQTGPSQVENSSVSRGLLPATKNLEPGAKSSNSEFQSIAKKARSSEMGVPDFLPSSGQAVRTILEHLNRNQPTAQEKSAELKLATAWKKHSSSEVADVTEHTSFQPLQGFASRRSSDLADQKVSAQANFDSENSIFKEKPQERDTSEATDNLNKGKASSRVIDGTTSSIRECDSGPSVDLIRTNDSRIKSAHEKTSLGLTDSKQKEMSKLPSLYNEINGQDVGKVVPSSSGSELPKKPPSHYSSRTKVNLTSIFVEKPDPRRTVSSDNSCGFTFPVSASSGVLSEPPTPSIMPSFSASGLPLPKEEPAVPSYTFGSKRSTPSLVFSFPSTSNASTHDEQADLKFNFGSDKKSRVSFKSVGKDAICY
ncbi:nuclear pore complex protein NUP1 [Cornus florida]|uniref:nuclear pore complex protein NUP1 n=1 Tax=Cornus florida TaxID=4283 RepID=UPI0028968F98|nr:nuclear pore complex protein NUP1 [Cornus florida]